MPKMSALNRRRSKIAKKVEELRKNGSDVVMHALIQPRAYRFLNEEEVAIAERYQADLHKCKDLPTPAYLTLKDKDKLERIRREGGDVLKYALRKHRTFPFLTPDERRQYLDAKDPTRKKVEPIHQRINRLAFYAQFQEEKACLLADLSKDETRRRVASVYQTVKRRLFELNQSQLRAVESQYNRTSTGQDYTLIAILDDVAR